MNGTSSLEQRKIEIGNRIRHERKKVLGISQGALAEELNRQRDIISKWENGYSLPDLTDLLGMCELFNCEVGYLLCEEGYENKTRKVTDICKSTGLSEEAVNLLIEDRERLAKLDKTRSLVLEVVERIIKNERQVKTSLLEHCDTKWKIKQIEESEDFSIIEKFFNESMREDLAKTLELREVNFLHRRIYFRSLLKDYVREQIDDALFGKRFSYYDENEKEWVITRYTEGELATDAHPFMDKHFNDFDWLFRRSESEKDELAIGLKFQKIVSDSIESILAGLEDK